MCARQEETTIYPGQTRIEKPEDVIFLTLAVKASDESYSPPKNINMKETRKITSRPTVKKNRN